MNLTRAEQELVAIGASVGAGCHPCLNYHMAEGERAGIQREALFQAVADAECVKRSAYNEQAVFARELLGEKAEMPAACCEDTNVPKELVSLGAAVGANSVAQFQKHADQAGNLGIESERIALAVEAARKVQARAAEITSTEAAQTPAGATATHEPIFLGAEAPATGDNEDCGPGCDCHEVPAASAETGCCGTSEAVTPEPVTAGARPCC